MNEIKNNVKKCSKCKVEKSIIYFFKDKRKLDGFRCLCKSCDKLSIDKYRLVNKERIELYRKMYRSSDQGKKVIKAHSKKYQLKLNHGMELEQFEAMLKVQDYKCAICSIDLLSNTVGKGPHVDHCHTTNRIRAILCPLCNLGLGAFRDNPIWLEEALRYLRKYSEETNATV